MPFSEEEFKSSIIKCNSSLTPGPNKLLWKHLKVIVIDSTYLKNFINIANACIILGYWPSQFKMSSFIIIPKPNKASYNSPNVFRPIVLINTLGKLIEKVINERIQFQSISKNFIYPCQLGGLKQHSTTNAEVTFTHLICVEYVINLMMNTLAFDIAQFFPLLNHCLLPLISDKVCFDSKISIFFQDYRVGRKMKYLWNNFSSPSFNVDIDVRQGSTLSPILSALYLSPIFDIFEKRLKDLKIPIYILSFVDNSFFVA